MKSLKTTECTDTAQEECGCCPADAAEISSNGEPYGCHERKTVLTYREERVLQKIREAHRRAKTLKERILALEGEETRSAAEEKGRALRELEALRNLRRELEEERLAAAEERMRLLGHI